MHIIYKRGHNSSLDGIRGAAVVLVVIFHCFENTLPEPFRSLTDFGWIGVDLFFVLSGFLITGILTDTRGQENYFGNFFAKRALRIFPLYYLTIIIFFGLLQIPAVTRHHPAFNPAHLQSAGYFFTFTQNLYFAYNGWGVTDIMNHFWSLAVEEQFYLVWPFVVYSLSNGQLLLACALLVCTSLGIRNAHADSDFSYVFTLARVDALAIGGMLAILIRTRSQVLNRLVLPVFAVASVIILWIACSTGYLHFRNVYFVRGGYTLLALCFAGIIAMVFDTGKTGRFVNAVFSTLALRFLGKYSYGIYIYHWIFYKVFFQYYEARYGLSRWYLLPFLGFVLVFSVLSYHYFESYFLRFKDRFNAGRSIEPSPASQDKSAINLS
ncbi:acyltransferase family protein [Dyadobacter sandarakinus]|uniref:Acyltransferase n=1 Tax=Dyadobacter sandarakinus TaxID=2747268 RepID=A0ABX7I4G5_9BACT|nr:acyltransferase [Dyadobacter sandarakinus]QRR00991.1 acyltransferase [Dyadobacter sandarakinus]